MYIVYNEESSVCPIITQEPLDRFISNFNRERREFFQLGLQILSSVGRFVKDQFLGKAGFPSMCNPGQKFGQIKHLWDLFM